MRGNVGIIRILHVFEFFPIVLQRLNHLQKIN